MSEAELEAARIDREVAAEVAADRLATITRIDRHFAKHPKRHAGGWSGEFAFAWQRKQLLEAQRRHERIERGEECERCGSSDIEHSAVITPLFACRTCGHATFDLTSE